MWMLFHLQNTLASSGIFLFWNLVGVFADFGNFVANGSSPTLMSHQQSCKEQLHCRCHLHCHTIPLLRKQTNSIQSNSSSANIFHQFNSYSQLTAPFFLQGNLDFLVLPPENVDNNHGWLNTNQGWDGWEQAQKHLQLNLQLLTKMHVIQTSTLINPYPNHYEEAYSLDE